MHNNGDDLMNKFPDEILVSILSFLMTKEAARTSVLSSRWKNLWKQILCLNFASDTAATGEPLAPVEWDKFVQGVNGDLKSLDMATLKEFRIRFDINSFDRHLQFQSSKTALSQWLEYACSRKVERLDLDLSASHYTSLRFPSLNCPLFPDFPNQRHDGSP